MIFRYLVLLIVTILIAACGNNDPSNDEIISAVRNSISGETYPEKVTKYRTEYRTIKSRRSCTQIEYETDPYKNNPSLGKCRGQDGTYGFGYTTTSREVPKQIPYTETVNKKCPTPSSVNSSIWKVNSHGNSRWTVSYGGNGWDVEHRDNGSFVITPRQACKNL